MRKLLLLLVCMVMAKLHAQTLITITATGSPGSYATGSVNSAGTKNDDLMTGINSSSNRGWAVFDLSAIPTGSTINTVTLKFTTTSASVSSSATNYIGGYAWSAATDPATLAGATLYTNLAANSSSNFNGSTWSVNALQTKTLNASGIALVSGNLGGKVVISFVRGSTNTYVINGYGSSAPPVLEIDYLSSVPCSGTPNAGVISGPVSGAVCPNATFTISSNAVNGVGGISYDWQYNTGSGWVSSGGTSVNYTVTGGITVPTDYRLVATCTNTNDRDTSNTVSLTVNPFYNCYCTPASTCTNEGIVNVTMGTLNNTSAMCAGGYTDFKGLGSQVSVVQGQQIAISVTDSINSNPSSAGVWIDYDHSSTFDASEFTLVGSTTAFTGNKMPFTFTNNINIPSGALTGVTAMRVRGANSSTPVAASGNYGPCNGTTVYGEYEDYLITINPGTACSGTPSAGSLSSTVTNVACSQQFIVSSAGYTSGVTGLTFQWEESTDGISFTPQGTSSPDYKNDTVLTITQTMYYRLAVTCGAGTPSYSDTMVVTFGAVAVPWTENFDALASTGTTSFPACWFKENGDWSTSAATSYNTSLSAPNHLRCAWAATNEYMWTPGFDLTANTSYDLSFFVAGDGWTGWTVDIFQNTAQISTGATQIGSTFTAPGTGSIAIQPYTKQTYTFVPSTSGTYYFAVRVNQPSGTPWYIAFDDFALNITPACPSPQSLTANNVTFNSADLQWTEVGTATQWEVEYAPSGNFTLGSGTRVYTTTNPHSLSSLTPSTTYSYFVRSICGPNDTSVWSARYTFLTACAPVNTFPWTENFDALASTGTTSFPLCWFKENGDWSTSPASSYNTSFSAPNHLRCAWSATNEYMWTPGFDLVANTSYDLSFQVAGDGWTSWVLDVFQNTAQSSTGATQLGSSYSPSGPNTTTIQPYNRQVYTFVPSTSGTYYFAVRVNEPSGSPWYMSFDDFMLELTPSCPAPQSLSTANVTANTADLQWTEMGSATQWEVEYGSSPLTLGSGTRTSTTTNPHSISGLNQATAYQFYVRSICGPGDTSSWSGPNSFTTTVSCPAPTALTISNITANSVDVNWTATGGTEILEYGPTGHVPGTGATAGTGGTIITGVTPPYTITGLSASSGYDVFIRQDCSASSNGFSLNLSAPVATTGAPANDTLCGAYTLTVGSTTPVWVNTTNATVTASDPQDFVSCTGANNSVWYQFTTTTAGVYDITGYSSQVTTTSALQNMSAWAWLYSATGACPSLTLTLVSDLTACSANLALPATNNAAPNVMRTISTPSLAAATTYYLFLDGNSGSYGNIGITVANPLAIKLDKISAVNNGNANRVDWNTLSEERGDRFELERSIDGKSFTRIYEQRANGEASRYTYMDNNAVKGMNHYRLRMVAANGSVTYSETVTAFVRSAGFEVEAFPNPVADELTVKVSGIQGADAAIQVTDLTGKVIQTVKMNGTLQTINMSGLANGIYLIKYSDVNHTQTIKVNKQ